ncbi:protein FAR1-RELATED SEQUENCE 2-like [Rhododendron vialii]|uniref:protein FAR1-RELATED SEQUENCE 2-like n=1 Tax=Rhododendron vialii TaxID=182163 RepID=UPI00265E64CC|nr:protein FAR1-RELATED SEQUENCE 2-like [Rhododendron vialii]
MTFGEVGEEWKKRVPFIVEFNGETNEANCNCRLFEFRGMVCRHQLMVFHERRVQKVPEKYVLRRWRKNLKRAHTKIRINYDNSSSTIEARRHDNMCNLFNKVADLTKDSHEKYDKVMGWLRELKRELIECSDDCGSNKTSGIPNDTCPLGDGVLPSKESRKILDLVALLRKGRPPTKRKQGFVEKLENEKNADGNVFGTQESVANVKFLFQNLRRKLYSSETLFRKKETQKDTTTSYF